MDKTKLIIEDEVLDFIANKALENGTGARGLKGILENNMLDIMYELPDIKNKESITLYIENNTIKYKVKFKNTSKSNKANIKTA